MARLRDSFAPYWQSIQEALFPHLEQALGPLTAKQQQLVQTLEVIRIEQWIPPQFRAPGRPSSDRAALARAFVAKAVYDMPTTRVLLDRLDTDAALRRICGWEGRSQVPSESVFSRAFAEFARSQLPQRVHEALVRKTHGDQLVGHLSRDSTAIEAREKPAAKEKAEAPPKRKRGRPKKGEERPKRRTRLERQSTLTLPEMLDDLPTDCDVGTKKNSKGYRDWGAPSLLGHGLRENPMSPGGGGMVRSRQVKGAGSAPTEGARRATGVGADAAAMGSGALAPGQRWSASRKRDVVLRLLRSEPLDAVSREVGVEVYRLERWKVRALAGLELGLKEQAGEPLAAELDAAKRHIGELSMDNELLRSRARAAERRLPLATRRSRR